MPSTAILPPAVHPKPRNRRSEIARARALTDALLGQVKPEAYFERPIPERHRIIFYLGHLEAFDWNLIARHGLGLNKITEELDDLFAFGIDPPMGQLPQDKPGDWPRLDQARDYVENLRRQLDLVLDNAPPEMLDMALEHRLMHAETFTYMLHNLAYEKRILPQQQGSGGAASQNGRSPNRQAHKPEMIEVTAGAVTLGKKRQSGFENSFGWDNEFEQHTREVAAFAMGRYKITNGEYLEFVNAAGQAPRYVPHYWRQRHGRATQGGAQWFYRGLYAEVPLPLDWPVYVSQQQATAYADWIGKSLPTEEQFHRAAFGVRDGGAPGESPGREEARDFPWGNTSPDSRFGSQAVGNFGFTHPDLVSVTATPAGDSGFGIAQLVGNGWEWTRTPLQPFPGFVASPAYPGYSANFFDGEHFVLKGASCVTDAALVRASFRNWFRKDYPYAYTTFRVVEN